ncbi:CinA-like protein [Yarrowia sp. C11]|nr:CinA-like protein [Yarrowia sp. E02]KAG5372906.1 CinA-like protein [Yarrowia sp. C11]
MFISERVQLLLDEISALLTEKGHTLAVSEAACGGLISSYLVAIPGASKYFTGGTLVYSLKSRLKLSGWSQTDIEQYTGPSESVALRLARNLKIELGSTYALSETGWAGPTGDAVGTGFVAVVGPSGSKSITFSTGSNDRAQNMEEFAFRALQFLLEQLK